MKITEFRILREGRKSYSLSLPCFLGEDEREYDEARRLNRFYSRLADSLVGYAESLFSADPVKEEYRCAFEAELSDSVTVTLSLSYVRRGERARRKTVTHTFSQGYAADENVYN